MASILSILEQCETAIRDGDLVRAGRLLEKLEVSRVPRRLRLPFSKLCFASDKHPTGLRLLGPIVRPKHAPQKEPATPHETAAYASHLLLLGNVDEALKLLAEIAPAAAPEALLYRAYCHMIQWDSAKAVECLSKLIAIAPDKALRLKARLNYASALRGVDRQGESIEVLTEIIAEAEAAGDRQLLADCLSIRGECYKDRRQFPEAQNDFAQALAIGGDTGSRGNIVLRSRAFIHGLQKNDEDPLLLARAKAEADKDWIALREIDFERLLIRYDEELFSHVYFGTPFQSYRERMCRDLGKQPTRTHYVLGRKSDPRLDLETGALDGKPILNPGKKVHQLLSVLLRDFYRPLQLGALFSGLFPGEYFDPDSSPGRVHQAVLRARRWIAQKRLPLEIREIDGSYRLAITGEISIRIPAEKLELSTHQTWLTRLRPLVRGKTTFTSQEVSRFLGVSLSAAKKFLVWAEQSGHVAREGYNRFTAYRLLTGTRAAA